jgi:hypothetical protein
MAAADHDDVKASWEKHEVVAWAADEKEAP